MAVPAGSRQTSKVPGFTMRKIIFIAVSVFAIRQPPLMAGTTFQEEVFPLFKESCISCHGPKKQMGRFRADLREEYLKDSGPGPWVIPGDSAASRLVALLSGDLKTKKSPEKHVLPQEKILVVRAWIDSGAK